MRAALVVLTCVAVVAASGDKLGAGEAVAGGRVAGGTSAAISEYPFAAALLFSFSTVFTQVCVGSVINTRSVVTAANCFLDDPASWWRVRVGSAQASSGGTLHNVAFYLIHPGFNASTRDSDLALIRTATIINYVANFVQPVPLAGINYNLPDNEIVWTCGWGSPEQNGPFGNLLRHVQVWTVNQEACRERMRFSTLARVVTDNMLCSGWLDVGGRGQCSGGAGSPLLHNGVLVGVYSWGVGCGLARYPDVNTRVSRFTQWIVTNA